MDELLCTDPIRELDNIEISDECLQELIVKIGLSKQPPGSNESEFGLDSQLSENIMGCLDKTDYEVCI